MPDKKLSKKRIKMKMFEVLAVSRPPAMRMPMALRLAVLAAMAVGILPAPAPATSPANANLSVKKLV